MHYSRVMVKKSDAVKAFGSETALALALGVKRQAVNQWGKHIPPLRAYKLREVMPELFAKGGALEGQKP